MLTPEAIALSRLKEEFDALMSVKDWERALDTMVLISQTVRLSRNQLARCEVRRLMNKGELGRDWAAFLQDDELETVVRDTYIDCAQFFPHCLGDGFGASEIRRFSWLENWNFLPWYLPEERTRLISEYWTRLTDYLEEQDEASLASALETAEQCSFQFGPTSTCNIEFAPQFTSFVDIYEVPSILSEYELFLNENNLESALDLLVVACFATPKDVEQLLVSIGPQLLRERVPEVGVKQLHYRLWVHAYNDLLSDLEADTGGVLDELIIDLRGTHDGLEFPIHCEPAKISSI